MSLVKDTRRDEIVVAVIGARSAVEEQELRTLCLDALAAYKVPRQIKFTSHGELPLTSTGKLQKNRLKELFG